MPPPAEQTSQPEPGWSGWEQAWQQAQYGPEGFYRSARPGEHFRTSTHVGDALGIALARLARGAGLQTLTDIGAGGGELLEAVHRADPGLGLLGVDLRARPPGLGEPIGWAGRAPRRMEGLLVANEVLDDLPCPVVEVDRAGRVRQVLVAARTGQERLGPPVGGGDAEWLRRWWPLEGAAPGARAEVGAPRDAAWARLVGGLAQGLAVAIDYGHVRSDRPRAGTLLGYRSGRAQPPVPDGSMNITAHVALDAAAAAPANGLRGWAYQHEALNALLATELAQPRPGVELARTDPAGYLAGLAMAGQLVELTDPSGLGSFVWLLHATGGLALPDWCRPGTPG